MIMYQTARALHYIDEMGDPTTLRQSTPCLLPRSRSFRQLIVREVKYSLRPNESFR